MFEITGVILAGGKSTRMGTDKALLRIGQSTMIKKIASELKKVFYRVLVVSDKTEFLHRHLGLPVVGDLRPGCGPLGGIHAGLVHAASTNVFVIACDMPFIDTRIIPLLVNSCSGYDAVVPRFGKYNEPLFAIYGKSCLPAIENNLNNECLRINDLLASLKVNYLDETLIKLDPVANLRRVFINTNTPGDFHVAVQIEKVNCFNQTRGNSIA